MQVLVIGGTGPTGPHVVNGLIAAGCTVTILHTGRHEVDDIPPSVEHIHTNPFDIAAVEEALAGRTFDLVYAMYGRLRDLARFFQGRCGRMLAVGGVPAYRGFALPQGNRPPGMLVPVRENAERAVADANVKVARIVQTEDAFFEAHPDGALFRYPLIYGPGQINPREWLVVRRILDGRRRVIVADGGVIRGFAVPGGNKYTRNQIDGLVDLAKQIARLVIERELHATLVQTLAQQTELDVHDRADLCAAERVTEWFHEDDECWIAECEQCCVPMAVWKRHDPDPSEEVRVVLKALLGTVVARHYGFECWFDEQMRTIPSHYHVHARPVGGFMGHGLRRG